MQPSVVVDRFASKSIEVSKVGVVFSSAANGRDPSADPECLVSGDRIHAVG